MAHAADPISATKIITALAVCRERDSGIYPKGIVNAINRSSSCFGRGRLGTGSNATLRCNPPPNRR
jgi:hypothetical protein